MNWFSRMRQPAGSASGALPKNARLIDVRSPGEYASGHVRGAINVPLDRLAHDIESIVPEKTEPVLLCCLSGARSAAACGLMQKLGYQQVRNGGSVGAVAMQLDRPIERG